MRKVIVSLCLAVLLSGCQGSTATKADATKKKADGQPIKVSHKETLLFTSASYNDLNASQKEMCDAIKKKHEAVAVTVVKLNKSALDLKDGITVNFSCLGNDIEIPGCTYKDGKLTCKEQVSLTVSDDKANGEIHEGKKDYFVENLGGGYLAIWQGVKGLKEVRPNPNK